MTTVLIVDDLEDNIKALSFDLSADDFEVISALNGEQALNKALQQQPDIILLDLVMPGMDGFEVCRRLKSSAKTRHIPIIIVSALDSQENIVKGLDHGATDYITKPYYYPITAARIRSALREKRNQSLLTQLNNDLDDARHMAESGARAKTTFLTNMSHEIRTPMNGVIGMAHLLGNTTLSDEQREYLQVIQQASDSLLNLIDQILDYSKIETGTVSLEEKTFNLRECIDTAVETIKEDCQDKNLPLYVVIGTGIAAGYRGDAGRIQQILHNLFNNAIKFTETGEVTLHVKLADTINNHQAMIHFSITDTGVGFDADIVEQLFEDFSQADDTTQRQFGGVGLGLAICRRLVQLLGGSITFHSVKGEGTSINFSLPLFHLTDDHTLSPGWHRLENTSALIVCNHPRRQHILSQHLSTFGCEALLCETTEDAVNELNVRFTGQQPPSFVIVDQASVDNWQHFPNDIHSVGKYTQLPIIALSDFACSLDNQQCQSLGYSGQLQQPLLYGGTYELILGALYRAEHAETTDEDVTHSHLPILLAEDNIVNQKVAAKMIDHLGLQVDIVSNGRDAVEAIKNKDYGLIFMDCQMPDMDGYEATRAIRNQEGLEKHIPIIALTAHAMRGERERCLAAGMDDYIAKPVKTPALKNMLNTWLKAPQD